VLQEISASLIDEEVIGQDPKWVQTELELFTALQL
jgi:hypothetical protein